MDGMNELRCFACGAFIEIRAVFPEEQEQADAIQKFLFESSRPTLCDQCYDKNPFKYPYVGSMN